MQNITDYEKFEDKMNFICKVYPDEDNEFFIEYRGDKSSVYGEAYYASNYELYMNKMIEQFKLYGQRFIYYANMEKNEFISYKKLLDIFLVVESVIFTYNLQLQDKNFGNIFLAAFTIIATLFGLSIVKKKLKLLRKRIANANVTQFYIDNKDLFVVDCYDFENDVKYSYNAVDMNSISRFSSIDELLNYLSLSIDDEPLRLNKKK